MANNSGLIDVISSNAIPDVKEVIKYVKELNSAIESVNRNPLSVAGGISGGGSRQLLAEIDELNRKLVEQQNQIQRLTAVRAQANTRTQEEITNTGFLAQNARLAAQANSTFANSYQRLSAQQAIAARNLQDIVARGRMAEQTQRDYNRELRNAQNEFNRLNTRVLAADRAVGRFNRNVGNYPMGAIKGLKDLVGAFGLVGGVTAFAMIAKDIFNTTRELQSLDLALKNVTQTEENFASTRQFLLRISEAFGIELNGLTRSYTGFLAASKNAIESGAITARQIQDIFESVSKASGAMGLSVEQQQGAFLALQQMISKGNVQAEEIRGQLAERLPGAFGILAKSMGVTEIELNKLLKDGKVLAAEVLPAFAKELEKAYGVENLERVESLAASTTRLSNAWTNLIRVISDGEGVFSKSLIKTIEIVGKAFDGIGEFLKSEDQRRKELEKGIEQKAYQEQLDTLNKIAETNKELAKSDANSIIESSKNGLRTLRQERQELYDTLDRLQDKLNNTKWGIGADVIKRQLRQQIKDQEEAINASFRTTQSFQGDLRAASEYLTGLNKKDSKERIELSDKELKEIRRRREEELNNLYRLQRLRLESEARGFDRTMNDVSLYYAEREAAAEDLSSKEIALAELTKKEGLRKAGQNKTLQLIVWEEYYKDYEAIVKDGEERAKKLREDSFKEFQDYMQTFDGEGLRVISTEDLASQFFKKQEEDAEKLKERIKELKNATDEYLRTFSEGFLSEAGLGSLKIFLDQTIDPIDGKIKSTFDKLIEGADTAKQKFAVTFTSIAAVAQEAFAFMNQSQQANFDAQYDRLNREKDISLQFAGDNAAAKTEIERQYQEKQREIRLKELQAQKEQALFNIAINTAQGITAALATVPPNVPLSIIIGAIGAAQAAVVAARQIPAYKDGTENHPGGPAWVGDGGKHELVHQPKLGWSITPKKATLVNLEKGSQVFPDLSKAGVFNSGIADMVQLNSGGLTVGQMDSIMAKHIGDLAIPFVSISKSGFEAGVQQRHAKTTYMNDVVRFKNRRIGN